MNKPSNEYSAAGPAGFSRWHIFSLVMSVLGIFSIVLFAITNYIWEDQMQDFMVVDAVTDIKKDLAAFQLGLVEYLNGDPDNDVGKARQKFFRASDTARKLLTGGEVETGRFLRPIDNRDFRAQAESMLVSMDKLQDITLLGLRERRSGWAGPGPVREFDAAFKVVMTKTEKLEEDMEKKIISSMDQFRRLYRTIMIVWSVIITGAATGLAILSKRRKRSESRLSALEQKYRSLVDSTDDSIYLVDSSCNYLFVNRKHLSRMGLSIENVENVNYGDLHSETETQVFQERVEKVFSTGASAQYEHQSFRDKRYFLQTFSPVKDTEEKITAVTVVSKNITDRKLMEDELRALSLTDELTGLYNRRGFMTLGEQQLRVAGRLKKRLYLISADLDDLKTVNDVMGHKAGDAALQETANILRSNFRESDIIARIGGDEFAIIPIEMTDESAEGILKRIGDSFDKNNDGNGRGYKLTVSLGISWCDPDGARSIEQLLELSDVSMYEQKRVKKNSQAAGS
ncbi:MAG: GGDEF domain-containing protein [Nitrospirae bacterium]|nr:GGDEF domain-containing protein [Nitrospirota bacterium]